MDNSIPGKKKKFWKSDLILTRSNRKIPFLLLLNVVQWSLLLRNFYFLVKSRKRENKSTIHTLSGFRGFEFKPGNECSKLLDNAWSACMPPCIIMKTFIKSWTLLKPIAYETNMLHLFFMWIFMCLDMHEFWLKQVFTCRYRVSFELTIAHLST